VLLAVVSFNIGRVTAQADFSAYRRVNSFQAIMRLTAIPLAYLWGLAGWILALSASAAAALFKLERPLVQPRAQFDFALIRRHLLEGGVLVAATFLWVQLLYSGRLLAALYYPDETIAAYGLFSSGYQVVASLVIAAFLPVTVETYRLFSDKGAEATRFVYRMINLSILPVFLLMAAAAELAPMLFGFFFPKYQVDPVIVRCLLYSLAGFPVLVTVGALFIGRNRGRTYVLILLVSLGLTWILLHALEPMLGYRAAAVAQATRILVCAASLLLTSLYLFRELIDRKGRRLLAIAGQLAILSAAYLSIRTMWT
jgi:O-antigen/teichoic acid export membrane protein